MLVFVLILAALTCFVLAAVGVVVPRVNLVAAGLAIATVAYLAAAFFGAATTV